MITSAQKVFSKKIVYLIPGQGSDERIYKNLKLNPDSFEIRYIKWEIPGKKETMKEFAKRLSLQIDTSTKFSLIGVSLGGMIATEMNEILEIETLVIISSAKCRSELPFQYRFQKYIPVYKIVPKRIIKYSAFIAQPLFERDRKKEKLTCVAMLKAKNPIFLKRTIGIIVNWDRKNYDSDIIHIHGDNDNTIPVKNVHYDFLINTGSHMMILTQTNDIERIILKILND